MLNDILAGTAGYASVEIIRRIVEIDKNKNLMTIIHLDKRGHVERFGILSAKEFVINKFQIQMVNVTKNG